MAEAIPTLLYNSRPAMAVSETNKVYIATRREDGSGVLYIRVHMRYPSTGTWTSVVIYNGSLEMEI